MTDRAGRNLPSEYPVTEYKCGLRAGDKVRIIRDIVIRDDYGLPAGKVYPGGEIWTVQPGALNEKVAVWFCRADGGLHTWDDDDLIYKIFEKIV